MLQVSFSLSVYKRYLYSETSNTPQFIHVGYFAESVFHIFINGHYTTLAFYSAMALSLGWRGLPPVCG